MTGWIGVDLDSTLAEYTRWKADGGVGKPIPLMVNRVKKWIASGKEVRIMTARVSNSGRSDDGAAFVIEQRKIIEAWCLLHIGIILPITCEKDYQMYELWDDRSVQLIPNTGIAIDPKRN